MERPSSSANPRLDLLRGVGSQSHDYHRPSSSSPGPRPLAAPSAPVERLWLEHLAIVRRAAASVGSQPCIVGVNLGIGLRLPLSRMSSVERAAFQTRGSVSRLRYLCRPATDPYPVAVPDREIRCTAAYRMPTTTTRPTRTSDSQSRNTTPMTAVVLHTNHRCRPLPASRSMAAPALLSVATV